VEFGEGEGGVSQHPGEGRQRVKEAVSFSRHFSQPSPTQTPADSATHITCVHETQQPGCIQIVVQSTWLIAHTSLSMFENCWPNLSPKKAQKYTVDSPFAVISLFIVNECYYDTICLNCNAFNRRCVGLTALTLISGRSNSRCLG